MLREVVNAQATADQTVAAYERRLGRKLSAEEWSTAWLQGFNTRSDIRDRQMLAPPARTALPWPFAAAALFCASLLCAAVAWQQRLLGIR